MPKVSRDTAQLNREGPVEDRHADIDGGEFVRGLPDDKCQCPHWGYVFKGKLTFRTDQGEEVFGPGDAFYLPPGHIPIVAAGSEYLQFSPTEQLQVVSDHILRKVREMHAGVQA